jgi:predicted metal-dependent phosphoesterase TrpH
MTSRRIDLHLHSTCSDGVESPTRVMEVAREQGLDVVSLTDHDTTAGWDEARAACARLGMTFVPGIELSASLEGDSVHLLGYLVDPDFPDLVDEAHKTRDDRVWRFESMVAKINADIAGLTPEFVYTFHTEGGTLGRPTIARALVELGVVATVSAAFDEILAPDNDRYFVGHYAPTIERAIEVVVAAGGVPVFAHPWTADRASLASPDLSDEAIDAKFGALVDIGLAGLEVHHEENTSVGRTRLTAIAAHYDLIITGSSDYHGDGMKPVLPGHYTTAPEMFERIAESGSGSAIAWA